MKKHRSLKLFLAACLALGIIIMPKNLMTAEAADIIATVYGTVSSSTTGDMLYLSTREGMMHIKLDSQTDVGDVKVLAPNTYLYASVTYGNDGYLHAAKIFREKQQTSYTLDNSKPITVSGTIGAKSNDKMLYFNTSGGEMNIKLDDTTKINAGKVLVLNKTYNISMVRGSDAYMHAVSIDDPNGNTSVGTTYGSAYTPSPASAVTAAASVFTGTVGGNTTDSMLYLNTSGGEMKIVIDANTDSRFGMVLTAGTSLTVTAYRGSDAYMHAAVIIAPKNASSYVNIDSASPVTVTGTVSSKSNENMLYLNTAQGEMQLKLDAVNSFNNLKVMVTGKQLSVSCARGSDAYLHALSIKGL